MDLDFAAIAQHLRLLSKLGSLTSLDIATHLVSNYNTTGGNDFKTSIGLVVPGSSGSIQVGTVKSPLEIGVADGVKSLFLNQSGSIPISPIIDINSTILNWKNYGTLSNANISNQATPVTLISGNYTGTATNNTIIVVAGAQLINHTPGAASWDLSIQAAGIILMTTRVFMNADTGSGSLFAMFRLGGTNTFNISLVATKVTGTTNLDSTVQYVTVCEF